MAGLLVSVRNAEEARAAVAGGAAVVDVKEPARGALGRADAAVWQAVRAVVPLEIPVSVALGELGEGQTPPVPAERAGIAFVKLGLAGGGTDWLDRWRSYRQALGCPDAAPKWVAVAYADADRVNAPSPFAVLEAAITAGCAGILLDTARKGGCSALRPDAWDQAHPRNALSQHRSGWLGFPSAQTPVASPLQTGVSKTSPQPPGRLDTMDSGEPYHWVSRAKAAGLFVALAGGLDAAAIARLSPLEPDLFAVRGAACEGGDRLRPVNAQRVAELVAIVRQGATRVSAWRP